MQTAIMWLQEQIFNSDWKNMSGEDKLKLFEQAKEMEYKQNMDAMQRGMELQNKENNRIGFRERNGLISSQTEISDEEIEKAARIYINKEDVFSSIERLRWVEGAKWYREQLKKKQ